MFKIGFIVVVCSMLLGGAVGAFTWTYAINEWLVFSSKPPNFLWWHGFLLGAIPYFGWFSVMAAFVTWILMMFLN